MTFYEIKIITCITIFFILKKKRNRNNIQIPSLILKLIKFWIVIVKYIPNKIFDCFPETKFVKIIN